ncbi:MAG: DUF6544 family protein [Rubrobacteraceae bacterium]
MTLQAERTRRTGGSPRPRRRVRGVFVALVVIVAAVLAAVAIFVAVSARATEAQIRAERDRVVELAFDAAPVTYDAGAVAELPEPVQRWVEFTFPEPPPEITWMRVSMEGEFRRPQTETFGETTAQQVSAATTPAFVFSATTPVGLGIWARAYDAYGAGEMDMKAKIASAITVVDEQETPELNRTSLRRWLLEAPLYPTALLPGGHVRWEPVDEDRARAVVSSDGLETSLVATFRPDGSLERFDAEEDGDLSTPYHGSGEHVLREDYRPVDGVMIPHRFSIARAADGRIYPFWRGQVTAVEFHTGR